MFWPEPNVDSGLVALVRRPPPPGDRAATFAVVDAAFATRRKSLRGALARWAGSPAAAEARLRAAGIDPSARGEQLSVTDFARLAATDAACRAVTGGAVTVRAPAKVNVHLGVGPLRRDGFHELATVYLAVSLFDTVTVRARRGAVARARGEGTARPGGAGPTDRTQPGWRAAELLAGHCRRAARRRAAVDKSIPAAAGLAGGSADAAAALVALDALWGTRAGREDLDDLAAQLGSDVPFSLHGGVALGSGRGELLSPVLARRRGTGCSASPARGCPPRPSTRSWTGCAPGPGARRRPAPSPEPRARRAAQRVDERPRRHAGATTCRSRRLAAPGAAPRARAATDAGAAAALVSGSGPTVAALAEDDDDAVRLAAELAGAGVFRTVRAVSGPVPGARVIS